MTDTVAPLAPAEAYRFEPQDRPSRFSWSRAFSVVLSLLVIATAVYQARAISLAEITAMIPSSPLFWAVFAVSYLAGPFSEWFIFRRLWGVGWRAFTAQIRKLIYNELLLGYLGEVYFYTWARKNLKFVATPFGAVKDVAIMSAMAGNVVTLLFLGAAFPILKLLPVTEYASAIAWSFAFVLGTSLLAMLLRKTIFSLSRRELWMVFWVHVLRTLTTTALSAWLWYLVLPQTPLMWWLVLATMRLLISRLPFVPNKDVVFAGIAVLAVGQEVELGALMAMMAGLILITHLLAGLAFGLADLVQGDRHAARSE